MEHRTRIYTIGHSNRELEEFVGLLREHGIQAVVDVRRRPYSRFAQFHRPTLKTTLTECLIGYFWRGHDLGGHREPLTYEEHMQTGQFRAALGEPVQFATEFPTAILCAEARPDRCHRRFIAEALQQEGFEVIHIIGPGEVWEQADGPQRRLEL